MADTDVSLLLPATSVRLDASAADRFDAVRQCGAALVGAGAVDASYIDSMVEREQSVSTYLAEGVAIPHGTLAGSHAVLRDALVVLRFPASVRWQDEDVRVCVGIAATRGGHVALLSQLAELLLDPAWARRLRAAERPAEVVALLGDAALRR